MTKKWDGFGSELGRSMIEMLGVLAIVGVLSIGGISAFQKAMNKHKINQVTEELSGFINELLRYSKDWRRKFSDTNENFVSLTSELDFFLPAKWTRNGLFVSDEMENKFQVQLRRKSDGSKPMIDIIYLFSGRNEQIKINLCMAYFDMAKSYADYIWRIGTWRQASDDSANSFFVFGNTYCGKYQKCLRDLTLAEIREMCNVFRGDDKGNFVGIYFPI